MLRTKGLSEKVIVLGLDGLDPRFSKAMVDAGKMPNLKKLIDMGATMIQTDRPEFMIEYLRSRGLHD